MCVILYSLHTYIINLYIYQRRKLKYGVKIRLAASHIYFSTIYIIKQ